VTREQVEAFIFLEARLQDTHNYDAWEALWAEDGIYWLPANGEGSDPKQEVSLAYDNRTRIASRIAQLKTGIHYPQVPPSNVVHLVSNLDLISETPEMVEAAVNFLAYESRPERQTLWAGRTTYRLRPTPEGLRMVLKKVVLANNDQPIPTLAFLI
jgi:3-phenylpropionate/cinnamic acid dioxygenase small subunit